MNYKEIESIREELHDKVGASISAVKMYQASIEKQLEDIPEEVEENFRIIDKLIDDSCESIRKLSKQLKDL